MLLDNFLPQELVDKIYRIRHSLELKDVHDEFQRTKIIVDGKLFILKQQQILTVNSCNHEFGQPKLLYSYYYRNNHSLLYSIKNIYS